MSRRRTGEDLTFEEFRAAVDASWRRRLGFWLQGFTTLRPLLLAYAGEAPGGYARYRNRVNGQFLAGITKKGAR